MTLILKLEETWEALWESVEAEVEWEEEDSVVGIIHLEEVQEDSEAVDSAEETNNSSDYYEHLY